MHRPAVFNVRAANDDRQCAQIGPLHEYVQRVEAAAHSLPLHDLAGQLHLAVEDPEANLRWIAALRERFGARQAVSFACDGNPASAAELLSDPADATTFLPAIHAMRLALEDVAVGEAVTFQGMIAAREGAVPVRGVAVKHNPSRLLGLVLACGAESASDADFLLHPIAAMVWHMQCADAAVGRLRIALGRISPLDLVQLLPLPCVMTDVAGRVLERNPAFGEFMESISLRSVTGRLRFDDPYLQDSWQVALTEVDATALRQSLLAVAPDGRQWCVHLVPLRFMLDSKSERTAILVVVEQRPPDAATAFDSALAELSRPLTPAEGDVLSALLQGFTAKVIARSRGASVNTVRSQIMAVLEKTGHHNQKSLIAAFSNSTFALSSGGPASTSQGPRSLRPLDPKR